jgi:rRNA maturation endonuclease Nob1
MGPAFPPAVFTKAAGGPSAKGGSSVGGSTEQKAKAAATAAAGALLLASAHSRFELDADDAAIDAVFERMAGRESVEALEAQVREVTSRTVVRHACESCDKVFDKYPAMCEAEGHVILRRERKEWAFRCTGCKERVMHPAEQCHRPCGKCGGRAWEHTSVVKLREWTERAGPALLARGEAQVNSLRHG